MKKKKPHTKTKPVRSPNKVIDELIAREQFVDLTMLLLRKRAAWRHLFQRARIHHIDWRGGVVTVERRAPGDKGHVIKPQSILSDSNWELVRAFIDSVFGK